MVFILIGIVTMAFGLNSGLSSDIMGASFATFNQGQLAAFFGFAPQAEPVLDIARIEDLLEELDTELDLESDLESELDLEPTSQLEPSLKVAPESKLEPKAEIKTEPKAEPKTETKIEPKNEPKVEIKSEPKPEPKVEPVPEPAPLPIISGLPKSEQQMLDLVNNERTSRGLKPLQAHSELIKAARLKSQDMVDGNYFSHNSPTYGSPGDLLKLFNIKYSARAENIAGNSSVERAHTALMNSKEGHKENILNENYTHIGIGIVHSGKYGLMFTQIFIKN
jgi:uncharacterized YkwD family protein